MTTRVRRQTPLEREREIFKRIRALEAVRQGLSSASGFETFPAWVIGQPSVWEYWPMDDASGSPQGVIGNRDLTVTGGITYSEDGPFVNMPELTSLGFNGTSGWLNYNLTAGEQALFVSTQPWTMMLWAAKTDTDFAAAFSFHNNGSGGSAASSAIHTFTAEELVFLRTPTTVQSGDTLTGSVWHHLAMTYAGSATGAGKLYLDGVEIATLTSTDSHGIARVRFATQGNIGVEGNFWGGFLAQAAMFTSELSAADIAEAAGLESAFNDAPAGMVPVSDGSGGYSWDWPLEVDF